MSNEKVTTTNIGPILDDRLKEKFLKLGVGQTGGKKMTCLESTHLPAQKLHNSFLSILVPIILRSDKNCGCARIFRDAGVRFLRFTRKFKQFSLFCPIT